MQDVYFVSLHREKDAIVADNEMADFVVKFIALAGDRASLRKDRKRQDGGFDLVDPSRGVGRRVFGNEDVRLRNFLLNDGMR